MQALKRIDDQARRLERTAQGPSLDSFVATERTASPSLDGQSVFGWEKDLTPPKATGTAGNRVCSRTRSPAASDRFGAVKN